MVGFQPIDCTDYRDIAHHAHLVRRSAPSIYVTKTQPPHPFGRLEAYAKVREPDVSRWAGPEQQ